MVSDVWIAPYKEGAALLKILFSDGCEGYCDLHPWVSLGEAPLKTQIASLFRKEPAPLIKEALLLARVDALARESGQSLLASCDPPKSYRLAYLSEDRKDGDHSVKIKLRKGDDVSKLKKWKGAKVRLDFNGRGDKGLAESAYKLLGDSLLYIEDPCIDSNEWQEIRRFCKVASDFMNYPSDLSIQKPHRLKNPPNASDVFTSSFSHPLDCCTAAYLANKWASKNEGGIKTHQTCVQKAYSERLGTGLKWVYGEGTGFGFDDLLRSEPWIKLSI